MQPAVEMIHTTRQLYNIKNNKQHITVIVTHLKHTHIVCTHIVCAQAIAGRKNPDQIVINFCTRVGVSDI